jgi:lipoate-protein ligase A
MVRLAKLGLWMEWEKRPGPEAMAVDEWLLATATEPILRVYQWAGDWASVGYFGKIAEARATIPSVNWVRRWTGGGLVDHRADWTYSLVIPHPAPLASARGAASYQVIHASLAAALAAEGLGVRLSGADEQTGAAMCFENPVHHDLVGTDGRKMAGAGQRRTRLGLLHQGSTASRCDATGAQQRAERLASGLAETCEMVTLKVNEGWIAHRIAGRYGAASWLERR